MDIRSAATKVNDSSGYGFLGVDDNELVKIDPNDLVKTTSVYLQMINDLSSHTGNGTIHVTTSDKTNWNAAKSHADSAHAPSNAQENIIEKVKVNGTAITPSSKTVNIPVPNYTASGNIALDGNNFSLSQNCIFMGDLNDAVFTGYYRGYNIKNAPVSDCWLFGFTISSDVNNVRQVFWKFAGNNVASMTLNDRYERVRCNGEWGEWTNTSVRKDVPSNAQFTDTTYVSGRGINIDKDEYNQNRINFLDTCVGVSDWNNADRTGFYIGYDAENSPTTGGFYYGIVIAQSTKTVRQIVWQFAVAVADGETKTTCNKYEREKENGTWRDWISANDADTLDGKHASYFAPAHLYLPLSGGTMTGDLTISNGSTLNIGESVKGEVAGSLEYDTTNKLLKISSQDIQLSSSNPVNTLNGISIGSGEDKISITPNSLSMVNYSLYKDGIDMGYYKITESGIESDYPIDFDRGIAIKDGNTGKKAYITHNGFSDTRDIKFPDKNGTIALTSDIPTTAEDVGADAKGSASSALEAAKDYSSANLASAKVYTDTKVADLVGTAPETMDALQEVAAAIEAHQDVTDALNSAIGNKVDKVKGKGLSTYDFKRKYKETIDDMPTSYSLNMGYNPESGAFETTNTEQNYKIAYKDPVTGETEEYTLPISYKKLFSKLNEKIADLAKNGVFKNKTDLDTHISGGTNPHGTTKSDVGLGDVGNFKAVSTVANQGLTETEKANARENIGAGKFIYETGTWEPQVGYQGSSNYSFTNGKYTRIGNIVHCSCEIYMKAKTSEIIYVSIYSLPFRDGLIFMSGQIESPEANVRYSLKHSPVNSFESSSKVPISPYAPTYYVTFTYRINS